MNPQLKNAIRSANEEMREIDDRDWLSHLERIETANALVQSANWILGYSVHEARLKGHTWSEIGQALDITKQAAQQRFAEFTG